MGILVLLSSISPMAVVIMLVVFGELSRRLGDVVKSASGHRWFYFCAMLASISVFIKVLSASAEEGLFDITRHPLLAFGYIAPLALSLLIGGITAWRYWGWLIYASEFTTR